jgi:alkanesulfonate monooxygenase SsuD/methylene tetrahydromethanopterin reductase-like flavin-dependent oxidoreductase (luciferase family)
VSEDAPFHLSVALDGAGWHPAAWREPDARSGELFTAGYWTDLISEAERGMLDLVTIEDSLGLQSTHYDRPDNRTDAVRGRLDALLIASRVAPSTRHIGLVPTVVVTHTEPFTVAGAIATLDHLTDGRAGVRVQVSGKANEADHFGRRRFPVIGVPDVSRPDFVRGMTQRFGEAADCVEVFRRLWDSRDGGEANTIDFEGPWFKIRGPGGTPRPPQGNPPVFSLAHVTVPFRFGARACDVVCVTPHDTAEIVAIKREIRVLQGEAGRSGDKVHIFGDLVVFLDTDAGSAASRKARLDDRSGAEYTSDALVFVGSAAELADLLVRWRRAGLSGFRLRPATLPHDLEMITRGLVPELQRRGLFRTSQPARTLRSRLGLPHPQNRYGSR